MKTLSKNEIELISGGRTFGVNERVALYSVMAVTVAAGFGILLEVFEKKRQVRLKEEFQAYMQQAGDY